MNKCQLTIADPSGEETLTGGALIPQGYKFHDDPKFPWICPVRSCRSLFSKLTGLGGHFNRGHRATLLNDNEDGTFSVVEKMEGVGVRMPAHVVTKKPLDSKEPPMVEPSLPWNYIYKASRLSASSPSHEGLDELKSSAVQKPIASVSVSSSSTPETYIGEDGMALWKYVQSKLVRTPLSPIPRRGRK